MTYNNLQRRFNDERAPDILHEFGYDRAKLARAWDDYVKVMQGLQIVTARQAQTWRNPYR